MTVTYYIDGNVVYKFWNEYNGVYGYPGFAKWLRDVKIPYAESVNPTRDGYNITFKEEKDLSYFLLTL